MDNLALGGTYKVNNVIIPKGGPKCVPARCNFNATGEIEIDGIMIVQNAQIEFLQGVFIDNRSNANAFTLETSGVGQVISCPAGKQGYFAILTTNPPRLIARTTQVGGLVVPIIFYNVPIQAQVW